MPESRDEENVTGPACLAGTRTTRTRLHLEFSLAGLPYAAGNVNEERAKAWIVRIAVTCMQPDLDDENKI